MKARTSTVLGALGLAAVALFGTVASASADSTSTWHLGYYNSSGRALSMSSADTASPNLAAFNFTNQPNTALLITDQGANKSGVLGNDLGQTVTAQFTIRDVSGFNYYGEPDGSGAPATVRLFFETTAGAFAYTNYWWSDTAFSDLTGNGTFTLTATVDPTTAAWSDWNGQSSSSNTSTFDAAASDVTGFGLSFGGGYFFENGVGTLDGSGTFTLNTIAVS